MTESCVFAVAGGEVFFQLQVEQLTLAQLLQHQVALLSDVTVELQFLREAMERSAFAW